MECQKIHTSKSEKNLKKLRILKLLEFKCCCFAEQNEAICYTVHSCYADPKRKEFITPRIFKCFAPFFNHETRLFAVISLKSTSFHYGNKVTLTF